MLSEISTADTNPAWYHFCVGSCKAELSGVVASSGWGKQGDVGQRVQSSSYKMNEFLGSNVQDGDNR